MLFTESRDQLSFTYSIVTLLVILGNYCSRTSSNLFRLYRKRLWRRSTHYP